MKTLGIILLAVGIIMTAFTGFTMVTKKKVIDVGSIEVNKEEKTPIYWSPITGVALAAAGVLVLAFARKKT